MVKLRIDGRNIHDADSFHTEFHRVLRFFDGYGRNMDAWVDCMTDLHGSSALSALKLPEGESVELVLTGTEDLASRCPAVFSDFVECTAVVNQQYVSIGSQLRIALVFE